MYCRNCGAKAADEAAFCEACGSRIMPPPEVMTSEPQYEPAAFDPIKKKKSRRILVIVSAGILVAACAILIPIFI